MLNKQIIRGIVISVRSWASPYLRPLKPCTNQHGMVLVIALCVMAIMSILGAMALSTAATEVGLSGNYKTSQAAFSAAQRAMEYAITNPAIYSSVGNGSFDLELPPHPQNISAGAVSRSKLLQVANDADEGPLDNKIHFLIEGNLPPGSGSDPTYFSAQFFVINVAGAGPKNSVTRVESQICRIVPR